MQQPHKSAFALPLISTLLLSSAHAAPQTITLRCDGVQKRTETIGGENPKVLTAPASLTYVIDLEQRTVKDQNGHVMKASISQDVIRFAHESKLEVPGDPNTQVSSTTRINGSINRVTGLLFDARTVNSTIGKIKSSAEAITNGECAQSNSKF